MSDPQASAPLPIFMVAVAHYVIGLAMVPLAIVLAVNAVIQLSAVLAVAALMLAGLGILTILSGRWIQAGRQRGRTLGLALYGLVVIGSVELAVVQFHHPVFLAGALLPLVCLGLLGIPQATSWFKR